MLVVKIGEGHKGESLLLSPGFRRGRNIEKARLDNGQLHYVIGDCYRVVLIYLTI